MQTARSSRDIHCGIRFAVLFFCLLTLFTADSVRAMNFDHYDLDSLVYMSSEIVEAKLMRFYKEHNLDLAEIKVTAVHKGAFEPGQSVAIAALNFYMIPDDKMEFNLNPLRIGDTFFFFLARAEKRFLWDIPDGAAIYWTTPSGLKLIRENKVIGFAQLSNPGPYEALLPKSHFNLTSPTPEEYREQIHTSIGNSFGLSEQLKKPATRADAPKLMRMLRLRMQNHDRWLRDAIAEDICTQLANLHDPEILLKAIAFTSRSNSQAILGRGLGTPAGRDALLKELGNEKEPLEKRKEYTYLLQEVGAIYHQTGATFTGKPLGSNAEYLTRIARMTFENRKHEELCISLLENLDFLFRTINQVKEEAILTDVHTALPVLKTLYDDTPSEQMKYQVEVTINDGSHEAYLQLNSPCGPAISILTIPAPGKYTKPAERSLAIEYSVSFIDKPVDTPTIVLVNQETGKFWIIPSKIPYYNLGNSSGGHSVSLPPDLPHGRYRIYLQFSRGDTIVGKSHYAETEL